jgi:hypothetical protein
MCVKMILRPASLSQDLKGKSGPSCPLGSLEATAETLSIWDGTIFFDSPIESVAHSVSPQNHALTFAPLVAY